MAVAVWIALKLMFVGWLLLPLLLPLLPVMIILILTLMVRAALKAGDSEYYLYPFSLRLMK